MSLTAAAAGSSPTPPRWALGVHGGAGVINATNAEWLADARSGLEASLRAGEAVLAAGGSAMDAVVAAVAALEDDPHFNAGVGSVLTASGAHELEASVMADDGACGAVTLLKRVANPVKLAQQVMQHTPHIFLSGPQAEAFAQQQGHVLVDNGAFTTPQRRQQWERYKDEERLAPADEIVQQPSAAAKRGPQQPQQQGQQQGQQQHSGGGQAPPSSSRLERGQQTVGAVAMDSHGRLAAATSTGGRTNKWDGRIGDTPIIGAGTWADARCALSGTGVGEAFIRRAAAHDVAARVAYKGVPLAQAVAEVVRGSFVPGDGGFVGVDAAGAVVWDFNSPGMYRGCADSSGRLVTAIFPDEAAQQAGQQTAG